MQIFYAPDIIGDSYSLDQKESRHLIRVLRMPAGAEVKLIDGDGNLYEGIISKPDQNKCIIGIKSKVHDFEKRNYRLHIAISPLKNTERFEWFVEKTVEIGIDEITPLICKYTEKSVIKAERINNIIISAMKQSLKAKKPILNSPCHFDEFLNSNTATSKMIAHCNNSFSRKKISEVCPKNEDITILIGPEGDFDISEIKNAMMKRFVPVHLGQSRLRTETAGIAACYSVYFINQ
jgi:16S rRNA (uracil1498-N3)-methyltransferase